MRKSLMQWLQDYAAREDPFARDETDADLGQLVTEYAEYRVGHLSLEETSLAPDVIATFDEAMETDPKVKDLVEEGMAVAEMLRDYDPVKALVELAEGKESISETIWEKLMANTLPLRRLVLEANGQVLTTEGAASVRHMISRFHGNGKPLDDTLKQALGIVMRKHQSVADLVALYDQRDRAARLLLRAAPNDRGKND